MILQSHLLYSLEYANVLLTNNTKTSLKMKSK